MQIEGSTLCEDMQFQAQQAHRTPLLGGVHRGELHLGGIDHGDSARSLDLHRVVGADERGGVLIETNTDGERILSKRGEHPSQAVALS